MDTLTSISTMPPEYALAKAIIFCNDCEQRATVPYHFIGHKCQNQECGSYNTNILSTESMPLFNAAGELISSPTNHATPSPTNDTTPLRRVRDLVELARSIDRASSGEEDESEGEVS
jgi:hypothetical protein